jgi:hypothetical protein
MEGFLLSKVAGLLFATLIVLEPSAQSFYIAADSRDSYRIAGKDKIDDTYCKIHKYGPIVVAIAGQVRIDAPGQSGKKLSWRIEDTTRKVVGEQSMVTLSSSKLEAIAQNWAMTSQQEVEAVTGGATIPAAGLYYGTNAIFAAPTNDGKVHAYLSQVIVERSGLIRLPNVMELHKEAVDGHPDVIRIVGISNEELSDAQAIARIGKLESVARETHQDVGGPTDLVKVSPSQIPRWIRHKAVCQ